MIDLLLAPLVACLILTGIHCYLGIHVLMRGVIFVDLALAQIAALGAGVGIVLGFAPGSVGAYAFALAFTFIGASVFSLGRFKDRRVPQEAVIGIVYAVGSAATILVLSHSAAELEQIEQMLVGHLLFVDWHEVGKTAGIYSVIAAIHIAARRPFLAVSRSESSAGDAPRHARLWDLLFYTTFGVVVTSSVQLAGVLLVFSFLIVPAACAMIFLTGTGPRLLAGWGFGLLGSAAGLGASAIWDFPAGVSVVATFGAMFALCAGGFWLHRRLMRSSARLPQDAIDPINQSGGPGPGGTSPALPR